MKPDSGKTAADKLRALQDRMAALRAREQKLTEQLAVKARREETRLKIIAGAGLLAHAANHPDFAALIRATLARAIVDDRQRAFLQSKGWIDTQRGAP